MDKLESHERPSFLCCLVSCLFKGKSKKIKIFKAITIGSRRFTRGIIFLFFFLFVSFDVVQEKRDLKVKFVKIVERTTEWRYCVKMEAAIRNGKNQRTFVAFRRMSVNSLFAPTNCLYPRERGISVIAAIF